MKLSLPKKGSFRLRLSQETALDNHDLKPVPPSKRTWRAVDWISYWISDQFAPATWQLGASMAATGVTARAAIPPPSSSASFLSVCHVGCRRHWRHLPRSVPRDQPRTLGHLWLAIPRRCTCLPGTHVAQYPHLDGRQSHRATAHLTVAARRALPICPITCRFGQHHHLARSAVLLHLLACPDAHHHDPRRQAQAFFRFKAIVCPPAFIAIGIWALVKTGGVESLCVDQ